MLLMNKLPTALITVFMSAVFLLTLSSCSPVYRVKYDYKIADDDKTKLCVSQCNQIRQACNQNENLSYQLCQVGRDDLIRAQHDYWHHHNSHSNHDEHTHSHDGISLEVFHDSNFYHRNANSQFCGVNYDSCTEAYNACFQTCGGEVESEVYCERNCDESRASEMLEDEPMVESDGS